MPNILWKKRYLLHGNSVHNQDESTLESVLPDAPHFFKIIQHAAGSPEGCTFVLTQLLSLTPILEKVTDDAGRKILSTILRDLLSMPSAASPAFLAIWLPQQIQQIMSLLRTLHNDERDYNRHATSSSSLTDLESY